MKTYPVFLHTVFLFYTHTPLVKIPAIRVPVLELGPAVLRPPLSQPLGGETQAQSRDSFSTNTNVVLAINFRVRSNDSSRRFRLSFGEVDSPL